MGTDSVFLLPDLGEGLTEVEVVRWLVGLGDEVVVDQPIAEVETAKAVVEVPSPLAGTVAIRHADAGATVLVGTPLITVRSGVANEDAASAYRQEERAGSGNVLIGYGTGAEPVAGRRRRPSSALAPSQARDDCPESESRRRPRVVSPLVRRLARDGGLDLRTIVPTGEGGVITRRDVVSALAGMENIVPAQTESTVAPQSKTGSARRAPLSGFQKAAITGLTRSRAEIPEATVWVDVDATLLWRMRESGRTPTDAGPGLLAYLARFVVAGLRSYPVLNSTLDLGRQEVVEHEHVNLGIAVQGERGLIVPAVLHAERMTVDELDVAIRDTAARAREGRSTPEELSAGTFTLNNYGAFRVDGSAAIIHHPQVAILGFGRILDRPWVVDGAITSRKITQMSFVFDHRVCDGGTAAGFMRVVADAMEDPAAAVRRL